MERFINILIIEPDPIIQNGLKEILSGAGNNVLIVSSFKEAFPLLEKREIGIFLLDIDLISDGSKFKMIRENSIFRNNYIILITKEDQQGIQLVRGINEGAVDHIIYPFSPNLVRSKIEVFKAMFFKDQRIGQLLKNIFPETILEELGNNNKFSPKRVDNGVVLFTDFVDFSQKAKQQKPLRLLQRLEKYFNAFRRNYNKVQSRENQDHGRCLYGTLWCYRKQTEVSRSCMFGSFRDSRIHEERTRSCTGYG